MELKIAPLPRIASDRTAIEQAFGNPLGNAVKCPDPHRTGQIEVSVEETAEGAVFQVRDNGLGIAEEDLCRDPKTSLSCWRKTTRATRG